MKLFIDNREPNDIINYIIDLKNSSSLKEKLEIIKTNLPLFDYIITNDNFTIENFENNLDNILVAIERKNENDLIASIKDGRYKEQGFRMENININNDKIYYLIEESFGSGKKKEVERKIIQSAIISLSYFKKFSILYTKNKLESSYLIEKFCEKIIKELSNKEVSNKEIIINIDDPNLENEIEKKSYNENDSLKKNYLANIKISKKENITPDNIDIIMLMQIPSININTAEALINEYKSIQNLIFSLQNNENILNNFKINNRKISKCSISNIKLFLHIKN